MNVIRHRIEVYHQETEPLFEFYPNDIIAEIDALLSPQGVHKQIMNAVKPLRTLINPTPAS